LTQAATRPRPAPAASGTRARLGAVAVLVSGAAAVVVLALLHLTQGTSTVDARDLLALLAGRGEDLTWNVLVASRVPRLLAGVVVGFALGFAGAAFQSLARNPLASPDTLAVNAGAHLAVVAVAALGISLPTLPIGGLAFVGGLLAAGLVFALSAGGASGPTRLILAGTATALALTSVTTVLLILHEQATIGLFAWGQGSLLQANLDAVVQMAPVVVAATVALLVAGHRLDILALGDDNASVLGVRVRRTRVLVTVLAVLLAAASVTIAGPVGFVGLCAPVIVRLLAARISVLQRHRVLLPAAGLAGVLVVLAADVLVRALLGAQAGVDLPIGVVTTLAGAVVLIWLARGRRDSGPTRQPPAARPGRARSRRVFGIKAAVLTAALVAAVTAAMLLGDTWVLTGDIANWVQGRTGPALTFVLDARLPRVLGAVLAGAALAVAGTVVQAVCRNPLAEPGLLGITAGAGLGAVSLITFIPVAGVLALSSVAGVGALLTFGLVYALSWRGGLSSDRLVLVGIGMWFGCMALTTAIIVLSDPWNTSKALTWLSGSTYGRTLPQVLPVAVAVGLVAPLLALGRRQLDLLSIDDDTPLVLGVRLERTRLLVLGGAALLTSTAVSAIGVVGFVGLVAPHAARALVGGQNIRVLPVAALLGALLVSVADTVGRTAIAPAQLPAGLLAALIGTPYFVWLLWRSRA
jgi:ferric hydroxamate transport system permease protein